ncbi:MAG: hypothetical protein BRD55_05585 [Bacteroidetes bacterium SW_9_63_38]|nr:MAG: hypothetical protein BRD55_05585 [Bacteroidetes bacterium SW_9_63_38]
MSGKDRKGLVLPTFLVCGAQKAGTTALYHALRAHPDVCMSIPKETEFFNWRCRRGWKWFASHFEHWNGETAIGEASTRTMPTPEAPGRIAERMPDVKLLFVLRNPVERAHSAFWYYYTQGTLCPGTDFSEFIRNEGHPLRQEIIHYGFYDRHLTRFLDEFDRTQLLLLRYRDLRNHPDEEIKRICEFIGVTVNDAASPSDSENVTRYPASRVLYTLAYRLWKPVDRFFSGWVEGRMEKIRRYGRKLFLQTERLTLRDEDREYLSRIYEPTKQRIQNDFDLDVSHWASGPTEQDVSEAGLGR